MLSEDVKQLIESQIANCEARISGDDGQHFDAQIISDEFTGLNSVKRQQLVYRILSPLITSGALHAFSMKTYTQAEWKQHNG